MTEKNMASEPASDHRTRVGNERRRKMRLRLIESAFIVFAEKGVDVSVIDDVIAVAGVSRGTFYNYFRANGELMAAVGETLSNELVDLIETTVGDIENPLEVLATGLRLFLHTARRYPRFADFLWRAGFNADAGGQLIYTYLPRHIVRSINSDLIDVQDPAQALEIIIGIALAAIFSISTRKPADDYPELMVKSALQALGVSDNDAETLVSYPLPKIELPEDSVLVKGHHLATSNADLSSRGDS